MNLIAVDDERPALVLLEEAIQKAAPDCALACFLRADEALAYAEKTRVDVAFLDINMAVMDGLALAKRLKAIYAKTNILFVTGYGNYALEAFAIAASGYIMKPAEPEAIALELRRLRNPVDEKREALAPYTIDHAARRVYLNGVDTLLKPKEFSLFCLFVERQGQVLMPEELYRELWNSDPNGNVHTVSVHVSSLRKKLSMDGEGMPSIKRQRGGGFYLALPET